jgi:hypothetical protein
MHLQFSKVDLHLLFMNRVTYHKVSNLNELHYFSSKETSHMFCYKWQLCNDKISEGAIFIDFTTLVVHTFNVFDNIFNYKTF